jgi:hypothetical protein
MNVSQEVGIVKPLMACRRRFFKDTSRTAKSKFRSLFLAPRTHQLKLSVSKRIRWTFEVVGTLFCDSKFTI